MQNRCQHPVVTNYGKRPCLKTAKKIIDGVAYCGKHGPEKSKKVVAK